MKRCEQALVADREDAAAEERRYVYHGTGRRHREPATGDRSVAVGPRPRFGS